MKLTKQDTRLRRARRGREKIKELAALRLSVHRTPQHIYAQIFAADGDKVLASPLAHVVIDDGRRYLERSPQQYDAILIDPPPPIDAAGSSLLYSRDFYLVARQRQHLEDKEQA